MANICELCLKRIDHFSEASNTDTNENIYLCEDCGDNVYDICYKKGINFMKAMEKVRMKLNV